MATRDSWHPTEGKTKADPYTTLELGRDASAADVKKAYRRQALRWHPDKNPDRQQEAEEMFKAVSEAYEVLSDPDKKSVYDALGWEGLEGGGGGGGGAAAGGGFRRGGGFHDPFDLFSQFFGGRDPFAEMFDGFGGGGGFAQRGGGGRAQPQRGARGVAFGGGFGGGFGGFGAFDDLMGGMDMRMGGGGGGGGGGGFSSFSSSSSFGGGGGRSVSTSTVIQNGRKITTTTTREADGTEHTERREEAVERGGGHHGFGQLPSAGSWGAQRLQR